MNDHAQSIKTVTRLELYFSVRHVNRVLKLLAPVFDFDYESVAIFLTVTEVCLQAILHLVALEPDQINLDQIYGDLNSIGMTTLSIGELTGIPRETVRRKIKAMTTAKILAVSPRNKHIYLPAAILINEKFLAIFDSHIRDVGQLLRAVSFYQRDSLGV